MKDETKNEEIETKAPTRAGLHPLRWFGSYFFTLYFILHPSYFLLASWRPVQVFTLRLDEEQSLSVQPLSWDATALTVQTAWAERLRVPRGQVGALTHWAGWRMVQQGSALAPLALKAPVPAGLLTLIVPVGSGALEVDAVSGLIRVPLANAGAVTAPMPAEHHAAEPLATPDTRVVVEWSATTLIITVDDVVRFAHLKRGPGAVRGVRCVDTTGNVQTPTTGPWTLSVPADLPASPHLGQQDELTLWTGDQWFGALRGGDGRTVRWEQRAVPWADVASVWPTPTARAVQTLVGDEVTVRVQSIGVAQDVLVGWRQAQSPTMVTLLHPILGKLELPKERIVEQRVRFRGQRHELLVGALHLGTRAQAEFRQPQPAGTQQSWGCPLTALPQQAHLRVQLAHLQPSTHGLEVRINDHSLGILNQQIDRATPGVRTVRLPVPTNQLRVGTNTVLLQLKPAADGTQTSVELRSVALEIEP
jgi:hypothetical protein